MSLFSSTVVSLPIDAALALVGFGGSPRVDVRTSNGRIAVDVEPAPRLRAESVDDDRWWLLRAKGGDWPPLAEISIELGVEGVFLPSATSGGALRPYPGTTETMRVAAGRSTTPPTMRFPLAAPAIVPHMTWPGNPPAWAAELTLAGLSSAAGPIVEVTLRVRGERGDTFERSGWIEVARPTASWPSASAAETIVGARLRDLAGNVTTYGDAS